MTDFEGVVPPLVAALEKRGYTTLTPVQKAMLEPNLKEADALVSAQTGSGKTVAFGMAIAPTLLEGAEKLGYCKAPLALVVAPTRELALQVKRELEWLYEPTGAIIASCVGGMDMRTERRTLDRGAHIVVGTPGRLGDHIERGSFNTAGLKAVVLDEADEMLDLGFRDELEFILEATPKERRTLMFSATVPRTIGALAKRYQRNAVRVATSEENKQHVDIDYRALTVAPNDRENAIINVLRYFEAKNALVFCATRATVNHMTSRLSNRGFSVVALSGELSQNERTHALQAMRDGRARVCVATDVAARGIDLPNLELVVHADIPKNAEILLHRSGRTGRAGRKGTCTLIVPHSGRKRTERLLRTANIEASWGKPPSVEEIVARDRERILDDPILSEAITEDEVTPVEELLSRYSADQIAAAFLRLHSAGKSAPEELLDTGPERSERPEKRRDDFKNGVWFSMPVGRKHSAEPRWILPMLCRAGHITKVGIGAIKIHENETHVEIAPDVVDQFLAAIGPSRTVDKGVVISRMDGVPTTPSEGGGYKHKKPFTPRKPEGRPDRKSEFKSGAPKREKKFDKPRAEKPYVKASEKKSFDKPRTDKPFVKSSDEKSFDKPRAEKPFVKSSDEKSFDKPRVEKPRDEKPSDKPGKKKKEKKPWTKKDRDIRDKKVKAAENKTKDKKTKKSKPAKSSTKEWSKDAPGSSPLKRKKLKS